MNNYYEYHESREELKRSEAMSEYPQECIDACEELNKKGYCILAKEGTGFCPLMEESVEE